MTRAGSRRRRARLAIAACLLWLVGVEALPALHEALHDRLAPHTHVGGTIITVVGAAPHRHADGTLHVAAHAPKAKRVLGGTRAANALGHAAGLAHHDAAIAPAPPPALAPLPIDRRPTRLPRAARLPWTSLDPLAPQARGPPSLA